MDQVMKICRVGVLKFSSPGCSNAITSFFSHYFPLQVLRNYECDICSRRRALHARQSVEREISIGFLTFHLNTVIEMTRDRVQTPAIINMDDDTGAEKWWRARAMFSDYFSFLAK